MGTALLKGWTRLDQCSVAVVDPSQRSKEIPSNADIAWHQTPEALDPSFAPDAIVLAVKPQQMAAALPAYARYHDAVFLSIAAGQTLKRLASLLADSHRAIVRTMPNLPASIGQGMSVAVANAQVTPDQKRLCEALLRAVGDVAWVEDETLLDPVTALSGSGPAYLFALTEAMAEAGEALGLPKELAARLARQTVVGSAALLAASTESPAALRQAVTSPGGTTAAALEHLLDEQGLTTLLRRAMQAAAKRAKELSS